MKRCRTTDMTVGPPLRLILYFSLPMLLGNLFNQLYNIVDSIIVGKFIGETALAAVGTGFPIVFLVSSLFSGLSTGATILAAQFYGAKNTEKLSSLGNSIYGALVIGIIPLTVLGILLCEPLLRFIRVPADVFDGTLLYVRILLGGMICSLGYHINTGILQGLGDSTTPLLFLLISCGINIVLDILLVTVFPFGIAGVAIATVMAQFISWLAGILYIRMKHPYMRLNPLHINWDLLKEVLKIGIPFGIQQSIFSVGRLSIQSLVNSYGYHFMAGFNGAGKLDTFAYMPIQSFSRAIVTYTGQNIGANRGNRVLQGARVTLSLACTFSIIIGGLVVLFGNPLMGLFSNNPEVISAGQAYLNRILPFYCMLCIFDIWNSVMRGAGELVVPMFSTIISLLIARVPAAYICVALFGRDNIFFCYAVGWGIGLIITGYYYYFGKWRNRLCTKD